MLDLLDAPPLSNTPTDYDWTHRICYLRLLDAERDGADWRNAAREIMDLDPDHDEGAHSAWSAHIERARWMTTHGYRSYLADT